MYKRQVLSCVFANVICPEGYNAQNIRERNQSPSLQHPFGTDSLGRSMLARVLYGGRNSLLKMCIRDSNSKEEKVPEVLLAETGGNGPNVVIYCAGLTYIAGEALKIITPAGRFVQVAYIRDEVSIPIVAVGAKEVSIIGSRLEHDDFESVIRAFPDKLEPVSYTHLDVYKRQVLPQIPASPTILTY